MPVTIRVGVISDTHGLLRPEALQALRGADQLIHAGDIGSMQVLQALEQIAPVTAVRGNNDRGPWAASLPADVRFEVAGLNIHVLHDLKALNLEPATAGIQVIVSGHSHIPKVERVGGVLFVNPGSAGPRRFKLPVSVAWLEIRGPRADAQVVELKV